MLEIPPHSIRVCADRGGTFCDLYASWPSDDPADADVVDGRKQLVVKLLSQDPGSYEDAPVEGIRRILEAATGKSHPRGVKLKTDKLESIRLSTTVATNALLERKGSRTALFVTRGFKDLLLIGNQTRPKIFDLAIERPPMLYEQVVEVDERVTLVGFTSDPKGVSDEGWAEDGTTWKGEGKVVRGLSGEGVRILKEPEAEPLRKQLQQIFDAGISSLSVVLIHSYTFPDHELFIGKLAREIGFEHISLSSQLLPMIKAVPRGISSTADAYLTPVLREYLDGFFNGFDLPADGSNDGMRVEFMGSDGGLLDHDNFSGLRSLLSGPAGGVVGFALTAYAATQKNPPPIIGLDVGGTSTDVSRFAGRFETVYETITAGVAIQSPQLDINTVAAGGGSCLTFRDGLFHAGPESAGAHPGPVCYRKGGPLALTDANLFLGRILPSFFPKCFGPRENEALDPAATEVAFKELRETIVRETGWEGSMDELVYGFVKIANETMARPIRTLTEARGFDLSKHILASFGGAGGQHACEIAQSLGVSRIVIHRFSSVLSAYGLALADRVHELQEPCSDVYSKEKTLPTLLKRLDGLETKVRKALEKQGFDKDKIRVERFLNMRYTGTDTSIMTLQPTDSLEFEAAFRSEYRQEFGFNLENTTITIDDIRVRGVGKTYSTLPPSPLEEFEELGGASAFKFVKAEERCKTTTSVYFKEGRNEKTPVYFLSELKKAEVVEGPAMIIDQTQTIVVIPGAKAFVTSDSLLIELSKQVSVVPAASMVAGRP